MREHTVTNADGIEMTVQLEDEDVERLYPDLKDGDKDKDKAEDSKGGAKQSETPANKQAAAQNKAGSKS